MKTTINIPDALGKQIKAVSRKRGMTVTAFIEESLRARLKAEENQAETFQIHLTTFHGAGDEATELRWDVIQGRVYP